ncbi:hypothetical protein [Roseisolibacter sp. H3M3-2]|uniref:hypothetical protein n=1 Tax=Roseisolibacter sp. H3M3-2 TaxID=3031323 RepID=UPI0023DB0EFA|nr:hypothetical protein [Roseisolibacter sp. H3M3-2]MDF1505199.1 hypothetical protein [Roseisolibacter sp. H3M3-2]
MSRLRAVPIAAAALALQACAYDCGTAARTVAGGTVRDAAGATLATVEVELRETVGPSAFHLSVGVLGAAGAAGAPLRGRVTVALLVAAGGAVLAEIPTDTATLYVDAVVALRVARVSEAEYARVRDALLAGRARVVLETALPGRERLEAAVGGARDLPGEVGRCSPT